MMPQQILQVSSDAVFQVQYRPSEKYKFKLLAPYSIRTGLIPLQGAGTDFAYLSPTGLLQISKEYAWDGASGPAIDTVDFIRGSCVHDALYQLIRERQLSMEFRAGADELLHTVIVQDDMWKIRAGWVYASVRIAGRLYMKLVPYERSA